VDPLQSRIAALENAYRSLSGSGDQATRDQAQQVALELAQLQMEAAAQAPQPLPAQFGPAAVAAQAAPPRGAPVTTLAPAFAAALTDPRNEVGRLARRSRDTHFSAWEAPGNDPIWRARKTQLGPAALAASYGDQRTPEALAARRARRTALQSNVDWAPQGVELPHRTQLAPPEEMQAAVGQPMPVAPPPPITTGPLATPPPGPAVVAAQRPGATPVAQPGYVPPNLPSWEEVRAEQARRRGYEDYERLQQAFNATPEGQAALARQAEQERRRRAEVEGLGAPELAPVVPLARKTTLAPAGVGPFAMPQPGPAMAAAQQAAPTQPLTAFGRALQATTQAGLAAAKGLTQSAQGAVKAAGVMTVIGGPVGQQIASRLFGGTVHGITQGYLTAGMPGAIAGGAAGLMGDVLGMGGAANPRSQATLEQSFDLLKTKLGTAIGADFWMDAMSKGVQETSGTLGRGKVREISGAIAGHAAELPGGFGTSITGMAYGSVRTFLDLAMGGGPGAPPKPGMQAPAILPGVGAAMGSAMSYEAYSQALGMSSLNASPIVQEQMLEQLKNMAGDIKTLAENSGGLKAITPAWR
jgi:hypothetical protein